MADSLPNNLPKPWIGLLTKEIKEEKDLIVISGICLMRFPRGGEALDTAQIRIDVPGRRGAVRASFSSRYGRAVMKGVRLNKYRFEVDIEEARDYDIQNKLIVNYKDKYEGYVVYDVKHGRKGRNKNSKLIIRDGATYYLRQNKRNRVFLVVRDSNRYDFPEEQARIARARRNSRKYKNEDIVLLFEKKCGKYEESAAVLYEKLIDMGCDNAYFIVDKSITAVQNLPEKYKSNLIDKDSDKHLEYFFASKKFISTETIDHALQLRIANKAAQDKINTNTRELEYVFLQHGPTYMVSLNLDLRNGFRKKTDYKLHKTVVSSELEAQHFIELGGMNREDLYITGMAKFDRCIRNERHDKIIIMPTWRRWETNQARDDITKTNYYKMVRLMYESVPEKWRDKVTVLPHPLMAERFENIETNSEDAEFASHILIADSYDEIFKSCDMLITDYSSISYDAYYRGANVVFYWAEKDECMTHYGEGTHLMLNMDNVFGPVAMDSAELSEIVIKTYGKEQRKQDIERYRKIIEFHDDRNTERIIEHLVKDGVININKYKMK